MKNWINKNRVPILLFCIAFVARVFLFYINFANTDYDLIGAIHGDDGYYEISQGLINGHGFTGATTEPFLPNALRTPLYIYFISGTLLMFGSYWIVLFFQIIIASFIPILGYRIALELLSKEKMALNLSPNLSLKIAFWTGILLAFEPYLVLFSSIFYTETLFIFLFLIFILIFIKYLNEGSSRALVWSSVFLGLATLTKPTVQYLPIILALLILWNFRKSFSRSKSIIHVVIFAGVFFMTLSPWLYRNYYEFGVVGMTAQPAYNLNVYLVPSVLSLENGTNFNDEVNKFVTVEESSGNKITLANSPEYKKRALNILKDHPMGLLKSAAVTFVTFFTHDGMLTVLQHAGYVPDMYIGKPAIFLLLSSPIDFFKTVSKYIASPFVLVLIMRLVWIGITLFFLIGLFQFLKTRKYDAISLLILMIVLYFVSTSVIGGLGVSARYRMPIDPIIFTLFLVGLVYFRSFILNAILAKREKRL
ncbi:MAG TPA: glycosyltransferase family 39 protein [Candidatus Paceibacterota bacterium]